MNRFKQGHIGIKWLQELVHSRQGECSQLRVNWYRFMLPSIETLVSLHQLYLADCVMLKSIQGVDDLTKLRLLYVNDCSELQELQGVDYCMALESLKAIGCPSLQWDDNVVEQLLQRVKQLDIW